MKFILFFLSCFIIGNVEADITVPLDTTYDIYNMPPSIEFNPIQTMYSFNPYSVIGCDSPSDDTNGACSVNARSGPNLGPSPAMESWGTINILLRETKSNKTIHSTIRGYRSTSCDNSYPWVSNTCLGDNDPATLYLGFDKSALSSLTAGNWQGKLIMHQRDTSFPSRIAGSIIVNLTINVTDDHKQIIYFPAFPNSDPRVDLNLNYRPGSGKNGGVSGSSSLDMCLYDGGTSAKTVRLLFQDQSVSVLGRDPDSFSIYRDGANKNQGGNRIDYKLQVVNPTTGGHDTVLNGKDIIWQNANARGIQRNVVLPGIPGVSLCLPAPLNFITPAFNYSEKSSGHYTGVLRVFYSIATH